MRDACSSCSRWTSTWLALVAGCWLLSFGSARAYEDQAGLSLGAGYGQLVGESALPAHGLLLDATFSVGLSDIWTARARASYGHHFGAEPLTVLFGSTDLLYLVDVLEWVPYFGVGLDGIGMLHAGDTAFELGAHPVLGLDWLLSREHTLGLELRPVFLLTALGSEPLYFSATLSFTWLFWL